MTTPSAQLRTIVNAHSPRSGGCCSSLCRPFRDSAAFVTPPTNEHIAGELYLSVDAVKKHMRALFEKFGVQHLPQNEKRARLVERAFAGGFISEQDSLAPRCYFGGTWGCRQSAPWLPRRARALDGDCLDSRVRPHRR